MDPLAHPFAPTPLLSNAIDDDSLTIIFSLCRALAQEQKAHQETKILLQNAVLHRDQSEVEVKPIKQVQSPGDISVARNNRPGSSKDSISQLQDAHFPTLINRCQTSQDFKSAILKHRSEVHVPVHSFDKNNNNQPLKHISLPLDHQQDDMPFDATTQSHSLETTSKHTRSFFSNSTSTDSQTTNRLIETSEDTLPSPRDSPDIASATTERRLRISNEDSQDSKRWMKDNLQTSNDPVLKIPNDFFEKYKKPPVPDLLDIEPQVLDTLEKKPNPCVSRNDCQELDLRREHNFQLAVEALVEEVNDCMNVPKRNKTILVLPVPNKWTNPQSPECTAVYQHFELNPIWHTDLENPIFDDKQEKSAALNCNIKADRQTIYSQHPVRYMPEPHDTDLYRTIMIDYLALGTNLRNVLAHVHGGQLESIQLFDPVSSLHPWMTARIVFKQEVAATQMWRYAVENPTIINGKPVRVWQVMEPTYPCLKHIEAAKSTRVLRIQNVPSHTAFINLRKKLTPFKEAGDIVLFRVYENELSVEFRNILEALHARTMLESDKSFNFATFTFDEDPCVGDWKRSLEEYDHA